MGNTIYWHDYETFGKDPRRDRPCQFAGIRTDEELNIVGDPLMLFCRPAPDFLPDPGACLVTGIGPADAARRGIGEAEFCASIHAEFTRPGTCVAGYNSIRFDDEVTRHLLYRCFLDPYEREWKNGNSRWDILDMLRLAWAVRPEDIQWPRREDGAPSFRLEDVCRANGIGHADAHDALADVMATIEVARLVRRAQPRLYDYLYGHRLKHTLLPMLEPRRREPLLHISAMYSAERGCLAVVLPVARHPLNNNGVIVCDLGRDPAAWLSLDAEELARRLFTLVAERPGDWQPIPLKTVHANKCPVLAPLSVLTDDVCARWGIDRAQCRGHMAAVLGDTGLAQRLAQVFAGARDAGPPEADPDRMLYSGGFFDPHDRAAMNEIRALPPEQLGAWRGRFHDPRLAEMLFRYRARNHPGCLDAAEQARWRDYCRQCLALGEGPGLSWSDYWEALAAARHEHPDKQPLLDELQRYGEDLGRQLGLEESKNEAQSGP